MGKKSKNADLGRALARKQQQRSSKNRSALNTSNAEIAAAVGRHTINGASRNNLVSVLEANDLDELMANATLANQSFVAERYSQPLAPQNVIVVTPTSSSVINENMISSTAPTKEKKHLNETELRIPRRPEWTTDMSFQTLMRNEDSAFLEWRRSIAELENGSSLQQGVMTLTPFEKNLDVWRQLWRVVERSDVVLQIVDARNPDLYLCPDLVRYVVHEMKRKHVVVMNKADLLSSDMLDRWNNEFKKRGMDVIFFSAFKASVGEKVHDPRIMDPQALIERLEKTETCNPTPRPDGRVVVGLCGYPNVGKSSTINVLLEAVAAASSPAISPTGDVENEVDDENGDDDEESMSGKGESRSTTGSSSTDGTGKEKEKENTSTTVVKRVAVSATPGKTKHFQTLPLTDHVMLCDCPGLVFPNFAASKAELICAGVLSIDTMRGDYISPVSLIARRMPASTVAAVYGLKFEMERELDDYASAALMMDTHAHARGFMTDHGRADQSRSARAILKDFVSGKLVYAHAPSDDRSDRGESGVGAAVFAKKGKLVRERVQAAEADRVAAMETDRVVKREAKAAAADLLIGDGDGGGVGNFEGVGGVRAMYSGKRKQGGRDGRKNRQEFVRVQRTYDSSFV